MSRETSRCVSLKIDVDTHDGMRDGVPTLLDQFRRRGVRATFFLSFGPDNAGKAIWNLLRRRGFLGKMVRTGAPRLYGWRTILSGTLLPARPIATAFPDLVKRIADEGHEVQVHAWDHRLWQDHLDRLEEAAIREQFTRAFAAYQRILGRRPRAVAAPAWYVTPASLEVQDSLALDYASDARGGRPGFPVLNGYRSATLQLPTTQPCLEELLVRGERKLPRQVEALAAAPPDGSAAVIPLHAEVEGGCFRAVLAALLERLEVCGAEVIPLAEMAERVRREGPPPVRQAGMCELPGRSGQVFSLLQ